MKSNSSKLFRIISLIVIAVFSVIGAFIWFLNSDSSTIDTDDITDVEIVDVEGTLPALPEPDYSCWDQETIDTCNSVSGDECIFYSDTCEPQFDETADAASPEEVEFTGCQPIDCNRKATFEDAKVVCEAAGQTWIPDEVDPYFGDCVCSTVEGLDERVTTCVEGVKECEALDDTAFNECKDGGFECFQQFGEESTPEGDACYTAACSTYDVAQSDAEACRIALDEANADETYAGCDDIILDDLHVFLFSTSTCVPQAEYDQYAQQEIDWQFSHFATE